MSGGEPLWRRVAGLYLSGIPLGGDERMSTRSTAAAGGTVGATDSKHEIVMLGEALDLITLAQGYTSPAVPMLLRALIRAVRQLAEAPREDAAAEGAPAAVQSEASGAAQAEEAPAAEKAETEAPAAPASETKTESAEAMQGAAAETAQRYEALEKKFTETDQRMTALTSAVGKLVDALQRRTREGGSVERRTSPRVPGGNAKLYVRGAAYQVVNWSRSGFLIRIADTDRLGRGPFDFHFVLELADETIEFQGRALPVRIERTLLAAEFSALDAATAKRLTDVAVRLAAAPA
jgi:hypothetical protein